MAYPNPVEPIASPYCLTPICVPCALRDPYAHIPARTERLPWVYFVQPGPEYRAIANLSGIGSAVEVNNN